MCIFSTILKYFLPKIMSCVTRIITFTTIPAAPGHFCGNLYKPHQRD